MAEVVDDKNNVLIIPDQICEHVGVKAVWGFGNDLFAFAGKGQPQEKPSGLPIKEAFIYPVKRDTDLHNPTSRKLVNESQGIFLKLQQLQNVPNTTEEKKIELVKISREYRSVIKASSLELQQLIDACFDEAEKESLISQLELWEIIELIWNLCEVLYIDTTPGGMVLSQLLDWLRMHFVDSEQIAHEAIQMEFPNKHPQYWNAVYGFALHGRMDEARQLLSKHEKAERPAYAVISHLMATMPLYTSFMGQSVGEFDVKWRHWQEECAQRLEQAEFSSHPELNTLCRILAGDDQVFVELRELMGEWYCMLISRLLFQHPTVKSFDLQYHTQFCIDAYGGHSQMQLYDNIILAAIEFDLHQVIREASESLGNWWFVAHLTDLLHHCGKLDNKSFQFGETLREFLLLEYASSLISHCSLWQVGFTYLDYCPQQGRYFLEQFVETIPLETERKAEKVLRICEQRELTDQVRSICKVMGMKALRNERLGSALSWGLRSKDVNFATFLAERFLDEYSENGDFSNLDLLDNLGSSMLLSSKLTFLGKYREFHRLYEDSDFKAAASLLLSLLTARIAPRKFWLTLLTDALPLLEAKEVIFDQQQTYELMHCLEELKMQKKLDEASSDKKSKQSDASKAKRTEIDNEKLDLLQLALARNLARAIVFEGVSSLQT